MKKAFLLIVIALTGCVHNQKYQTPQAALAAEDDLNASLNLTQQIQLEAQQAQALARQLKK